MGQQKHKDESEGACEEEIERQGLNGGRGGRETLSAQGLWQAS